MEFFRTERLIIRRFEKEDAPDLFDYFEEPRVNCFMEEKLSDLGEALAETEKKSWDSSQFAVCLKENGSLIGNLFAYPERDSDTYGVGWNFNSKFGGQGFASEAAKGLFDYLFEEKNTRRIYCYVEEDNLPSQKLCKRLGMRQEGLFLDYVSFVKNVDGSLRYENTMQFAILKREWERK